MTRKEFILKAMIAMSSNPKFMSVVHSSNLDVRAIYENAEKLAEEANEKLEYPFDVDLE